MQIRENVQKNFRKLFESYFVDNDLDVMVYPTTPVAAIPIGSDADLKVLAVVPVVPVVLLLTCGEGIKAPCVSIYHVAASRLIATLILNWSRVREYLWFVRCISTALLLII